MRAQRIAALALLGALLLAPWTAQAADNTRPTPPPLKPLERLRERITEKISQLPGHAALKMAIHGELAVEPNRTQARDLQGKPLPVLRRAIKFRREHGVTRLQLPVALHAGEKMAELKGEGMELQGHQMTMPLKSDGNEVAKIRARLGEIQPTTGGAEATVESMELETQPLQADFTKDDPRVGKTRFLLKAGLREMPPAARLDMQPTRDIDEKVKENYRQALQARGRTLQDIAYAVAVDTENLSIQNSTLQMQVAQDWVQAHGGPEAIRILRMPDNGTPAEALPTLFQGTDTEGQATFQADATGLSIFSLAATAETATAASPTPAVEAPAATRRTPGMEGTISVLSILTILLLRRRNPR